MDHSRFEALVRRVGQAGSRRAAVTALAAGLAGSLLGRPEPVEAGLPIVHCKPPGKRCDKDKKCCSGNCRRGVCSCSKRGKPCWNPLEGALCCSQRCHQGKCA